MGMSTSRVNLLFNFSNIIQVSFSEFVIDDHYYTSPNQLKSPPSPTHSFTGSDSKNYYGHVTIFTPTRLSSGSGLSFVRVLGPCFVSYFFPFLRPKESVIHGYVNLSC
jgi:hypothetical protein